MRALRKSELVVVARAKGWRGSESRLDREFFTQWLSQHNVTETEQRDLVRRWKTGAIGNDGQQAAAQVGITRTEVVELINRHVGERSDEQVSGDELRKLIAEQVAKAQPEKIIIKDGAKPVALKERTHPVFEKVLRLVTAGLNVLLVGPAGCGKTHLAAQLAKALKRKFGTLHCTSGASESQLGGWLLPIKSGGAFEYVASQFVQLYEEGNSLFLLDEIDAADPNMLLFINGALANGSLHIPQRHGDSTVPRGKNAAIIAAANTFGTGADMIYAGRNQLDGATLDRFYVVKMDYDTTFEAELAPKEICDWVWGIRSKAADLKLRRVISTRTIQKGAAAVAAGLKWDDVKTDLLAGWTRDEMTKVGV